jgi:serine/threonine protein kinase
MMILEFANQGNLKSIISNNFKNILWKDKINYLYGITNDLKYLHELGYVHKNFHSGNVLLVKYNTIYSCISDFRLSEPSIIRESDDKICGVLPYIAPEVLKGESYTLSSDIYSLGVIMTELSSGKPPFHNRKHDISLALDICNGLRPEFGKGTPEIYKKLAYECMSADLNQRPTASELRDIFEYWNECMGNSALIDRFDYKGKEVKTVFEEADKEIPNISTSFEDDRDPDAIYTSRVFTFNKIN